MAFWNVAGLKNEDRDFWNGLRDWDVVTLTETWIEKKKWSNLKEKLLGGYVWELQEAKKRYKKGRALRGIVMGIMKELIEEEMKIETNRERLVVGRMKWGGGEIENYNGIHEKRGIGEDARGSENMGKGKGGTSVDVSGGRL